MSGKSQYGFVLIGRNEGDRLKACVRSLPPGAPAVYVDSASTDESVAFAKAHGVVVVDLDMSRPFTAARARNEGLARLTKARPDLAYVQFVDGDCEVVEGWCETAAAALDADERLAIVCGRRLEKYPDASLYNALCHVEWNTPVGEAKACGGDAMMKIAALNAIGAFDPTMNAHEEPEMCTRMREAGHRIARLDADMTRHDAAMTRFSQFWRRHVRAGYGFAQADRKYRDTHKADPASQRTNAAEGLIRRTVLWGIAIPVAVLVAAAVYWPMALLVALLYPFQILRRFVSLEPRDTFALQRSVFEMISKFAEARGFFTFYSDYLRSRQRNAITYK